MMVSRRQGRRSAGEPEALAGGAVDHHVEDPALPGWPEPLPSALLRMQAVLSACRSPGRKCWRSGARRCAGSTMQASTD
jgi:hypothetical protein